MKLPESKIDFINDIVFENVRYLDWSEIVCIATGRIERKDIRAEMSIRYSAWLDLFIMYGDGEKPKYFGPELIDELTDAYIAEAMGKYESD